MQGGLGQKNVALDQRADDERSVCFDTGTLEEDLEIAGVLSAQLEVVGHSHGMDIAARVTDVDLDGTSLLITKGFVRLSNPLPFRGAGSTEAPRTVRIEFNPTRYRLIRGHRLRLALACADFPEIWHRRDAHGYTLMLGSGSAVDVPTLTSPSRLTEPAFASPDTSLASETSNTSRDFYRIHRDGGSVASVEGGWEATYDALTGASVSYTHHYTMSTDGLAPLETTLTTQTRLTVAAPDDTVTVEADTYTSHDSSRASVLVVVNGVQALARDFAGPALQSS
jgi:hypothetical protein